MLIEGHRQSVQKFICICFVLDPQLIETRIAHTFTQSNGNQIISAMLIQQTFSLDNFEQSFQTC